MVDWTDSVRLPSRNSYLGKVFRFHLLHQSPLVESGLQFHQLRGTRTLEYPDVTGDVPEDDEVSTVAKDSYGFRRHISACFPVRFLHLLLFSVLGIFKYTIPTRPSYPHDEALQRYNHESR